MLRVMRNHRLAAYDAENTKVEYQAAGYQPAIAPTICQGGYKAWDEAYNWVRNTAIAMHRPTVIAPPRATIGLVMDCDTTASNLILPSSNSETIRGRLFQDHQTSPCRRP